MKYSDNIEIWTEAEQETVDLTMDRASGTGELNKNEYYAFMLRDFVVPIYGKQAGDARQFFSEGRGWWKLESSQLTTIDGPHPYISKDARKLNPRPERGFVVVVTVQDVKQCTLLRSRC